MHQNKNSIIESHCILLFATRTSVQNASLSMGFFGNTGDCRYVYFKSMARQNCGGKGLHKHFQANPTFYLT